MADDLPDIVKLTVVGLALDPPRVDPEVAQPNYVAALEALVTFGVALSSIEGRCRRYHLTAFGFQVYEIVKAHTPHDSTLPANDLDNGDDFPPSVA